VLLKKDGRGGAITALVRQHLAPFADSARIETDGPHILLNSSAAESIGLALHELATNAVKYRALSVVDGKVSIRWQFAGQKRRSVLAAEMAGTRWSTRHATAAQRIRTRRHPRRGGGVASR
jgi:two-component sensor histidine kinase